MASTDFYPRLCAHAADLKAKAFGFGRGEPKLPSAEDLDKVAEEEKAKAATTKPTKPKRVIVAKG